MLNQKAAPARCGKGPDKLGPFREIEMAGFRLVDCDRANQITATSQLSLTPKPKVVNPKLLNPEHQWRVQYDTSA